MPKVTKADVIEEAATQLMKVLQGEIPANIKKTDKEHLTHLASMFLTTAKNTSNIYADGKPSQYNPETRVEQDGTATTKQGGASKGET